MDYKQLYELISQSNFTTIGYPFEDKNLRDRLISKLAYISYKEIDPSFSLDVNIKQKLRDIRLNSILNDDVNIGINYEYLVIDFEDLPYCEEYSNKFEISRSIQLNFILERLRYQSMECGIKVIFTTPTYTSFDLKQSLKGGSKCIYMADLVFIINDGIVEIMKNRFGVDNKTFSLNEL